MPSLCYDVIMMYHVMFKNDLIKVSNVYIHYAKYTHAVSGYTPRHDEVAKRTPKADEEGEGKYAHCPSGL